MQLFHLIMVRRRNLDVVGEIDITAMPPHHLQSLVHALCLEVVDVRLLHAENISRKGALEAVQALSSINDRLALQIALNVVERALEPVTWEWMLQYVTVRSREGTVREIRVRTVVVGQPACRDGVDLEEALEEGLELFQNLVREIESAVFVEERDGRVLRGVHMWELELVPEEDDVQSAFLRQPHPSNDCCDCLLL